MNVSNANVGSSNLALVEGSVYRTDRYDIHVSKDEVKVFDRETREWVRFFGDPHFETGDGDLAGFHKGNVTLDLEDGTKLTIVPTEKDANGAAWIDRVVITNGENGVEITGVHSAAGPEFSEVGDDGLRLDQQTKDGSVLHVGGALDDLYFIGKDGERVDVRGAMGDRALEALGGYSDNYSFALPEANAGVNQGEWDLVFENAAKVDVLKQQLKDPNLSAEEKQAILMEISELNQFNSLLIQQMSEEQRRHYETMRTILQGMRG